jgi:hypothetical protein
MEGDFRLRWEGDIIYGDNVAAGEIGMGFATGRLSLDGAHVLVRDANYHSDGGQVCKGRKFRNFGTSFTIYKIRLVGQRKSWPCLSVMHKFYLIALPACTYHY